MHQPPRRWGGRGRGGAPWFLWFLLASLCTLSAHGALTTCLGSGCPDQGPLPDITTLYRRIAAWSDFTEPLAVLRLGRPAGALHFLPPPRGQAEAAGGLLAVGDDAGTLHLLSLDGRVVAQHHTGTASPVTTLGSYRLGHNTTVLLTGHASGELRLHALVAPSSTQRHRGSSWEEAAAGNPPPSLSFLEAFAPEDLLCGTPAAAACTDGGGGGSAGGSSGASGSSPGACAAAPACAPITTIHSLAWGGMAAATAVVADGLGRLAVLKHGGPTGLGVRVVRRATLEQAPTALRLAGATAAVLGSSGTASQPLSQPAAEAAHGAGAANQQTHKGDVPEGEAGAAAGAVPSPAFRNCRGLGGSSIVAAAFDGQHTNRAYAVATNGSVLALVVGGERGTPSGCTVRSSAPLPAGLLLPQQQSSGGNGGSSTAFQQMLQQQQAAAVQLSVLPGYLVITAAGGQLAVFNVTAAPRSPPRLLLHQPVSALAERFDVVPAASAEGARPPPPPLLLAGGKQGQHVALMLNATVLALYQAAFPYREPLQPNKGALAWMQVLQPLGMVGVAVVVLAKARARRGGGDASDFGLDASGGGMASDPRLREFERLLQNPLTGGATARQRHRPWGDGSGSEMEDSGGGRARGGAGSRGAGRAKDKQGSGGGGLLGRLRSGASGGGGSRGRDARWRRAAAAAAGDDADIAALRDELAGGGLGGGGSEDEDMELEVDAERLAGGGSGAFGSVLSEDAEAPLLGGAGRRGSDDLSALSQLRQRFGQARIS